MYYVKNENDEWVQIAPELINHLQYYRFVDQNGGTVESYWYKPEAP